jgi:hypothetical protein
MGDGSSVSPTILDVYILVSCPEHGGGRRELRRSIKEKLTS